MAILKLRKFRFVSVFPIQLFCDQPMIIENKVRVWPSLISCMPTTLSSHPFRTVYNGVFNYYISALGGGHTGLWNIGMWHFNQNMSFQSQMDPKLFNLILKIIIVTPKTLNRFIFCIWEIFFKNFERFLLKCSTFVNVWARKTFFFF